MAVNLYDVTEWIFHVDHAVRLLARVVVARSLHTSLTTVLDNFLCQTFQTSSQFKTINWTTLVELGYIDHPDRAHHATQLLGVNFSEFGRINQLPHRGFSNQIGMTLNPVSKNLGFTVLPSHAINAFRDQKKIHCHSLKQQVSETIYLTQQRWNSLPAKFQKITTIIRKELGSKG